MNEPFPDFKLADGGGNIVSKSDLLGKPTIIYFYPKDDTSGCTLEAKEFQVSQTAHDSINVVGVSPDTAASHGKFAKKYGLTFTLLVDEDHKLADQLGVWVEKSMYGKKYMGIERSTFLLNAQGEIVEVWKKVKPAGHAAEVMTKAASLLGG